MLRLHEGPPVARVFWLTRFTGRPKRIFQSPPPRVCQACERPLRNVRSFMQGTGPGEPSHQMNLYACDRCERGWLAAHVGGDLEPFSYYVPFDVPDIPA